jgi:hypothetical protein
MVDGRVWAGVPGSQEGQGQAETNGQGGPRHAHGQGVQEGFPPSAKLREVRRKHLPDQFEERGCPLAQAREIKQARGLERQQDGEKEGRGEPETARPAPPVLAQDGIEGLVHDRATWRGWRSPA